jgi:hypothetical protein
MQDVSKEVRFEIVDGWCVVEEVWWSYLQMASTVPALSHVVAALYSAQDPLDSQAAQRRLNRLHNPEAHCE